jgi:hypothetical protein
MIGGGYVDPSEMNEQNSMESYITFFIAGI